VSLYKKTELGYLYYFRRYIAMSKSSRYSMGFP